MISGNHGKKVWGNKKQTCRGKPAYVLPGPKGHGGDEED